MSGDHAETAAKTDTLQRVTHHRFSQQVQARFIPSGTRLARERRHSSFMMPPIRQTRNRPRPVLRAGQSFENRELIGRMIFFIDIIEHTRSWQVRDLGAES